MRLLAGLMVAVAACSAAEYDIVIHNARVVDGTGNPWYRADVALQGGRIAGIGKLDLSKAARVIEAEGRVVTPGFIDVHTHVEGGIEKIPRADNFLMDGV